jgi:hypothetical protein
VATACQSIGDNGGDATMLREVIMTLAESPLPSIERVAETYNVVNEFRKNHKETRHEEDAKKVALAVREVLVLCSHYLSIRIAAVASVDGDSNNKETESKWPHPAPRAWRYAILGVMPETFSWGVDGGLLCYQCSYSVH